MFNIVVSSACELFFLFFLLSQLKNQYHDGINTAEKMCSITLILAIDKAMLGFNVLMVDDRKHNFLQEIW